MLQERETREIPEHAVDVRMNAGTVEQGQIERKLGPRAERREHMRIAGQEHRGWRHAGLPAPLLDLGPLLGLQPSGTPLEDGRVDLCRIDGNR